MSKLKQRDLKGWQSVFLYKAYVKMLLTLLPFTRLNLKDYNAFIEALEALTDEERRIIFSEIITFASDDEIEFFGSALEDSNGVQLSSMNIANFHSDEIMGALVEVFDNQYKVGREGFFLKQLSEKPKQNSQ